MTIRYQLTIHCTATDPAEDGGSPYRCGETWQLQSFPAGIFTLAGWEAAARAEAEEAGWSCCHRQVGDHGTAMVDLCPRHARAQAVPG